MNGYVYSDDFFASGGEMISRQERITGMIT